MFNDVEHLLQVGDQEGSGGRRGLHTGVGHHVEDALVALMTDAGDDGQREVRHVLG